MQQLQKMIVSYAFKVVLMMSMVSMRSNDSGLLFTAYAMNVSITGEPVVDVWAAVDTLHKCGIIDVPDIPARAFVDDVGVTHLIEGSTKFHWMNGPSVVNFTRNCSIAFNMTGDYNPAMFAGDEFLDSPIIFKNGTVISLIHTEYPGNVYDNCTGPAYPHCWTVTIGLAVSYDKGYTWQHARPPPNHLVAAVPYQYNQTQLAYGWGDPSNIVKSPKDGFYYVAMWNRNQVGLQAPGICIARTNNLMDPSAWRGWNGKQKDFSVMFVSPYTMKPGTEEQHICTVVNLPMPGQCAPAGLAWSAYLNQFIITLGCGSKFQIATSDDLVQWNPAQELYPMSQIPPNISKMVRGRNYPTFIDPTAPSVFSDPNFYTVGQKPYLYWVSIGHSPHTDGRHLWATPMRFTK